MFSVNIYYEEIMVFSSLFFIGVFLPVFLLIYYMSPGITIKNRVLLIFSLLFYGFGGIKYLILIMVMSCFGWFFARRIYESKIYSNKKKWLCLSVIIYLANLVIFKYTGFIWDTFAYFSGYESGIISLAMPIGISFYTFKLISYTVDVYRGDTPAFKGYAPVLFYTAIFHHSLQGPIVRIGDMRQDMYIRRINREDISAGVWRFTMGLGKKLLLADPIGGIADSLVPLGGASQSVPVTGVWLGMLMFSLQLYLDFSGYSDMALGLGRMCGFSYPENFNYPYVASSVKDFWRRWHISLSSFFRDYVYIPLGGNQKSAVRVVFNLAIVWALTGLWHGAGWNFILWGLYYFVILSIERVIKPEEKPILKYISYPLTFIIVVFGWLLFRFTDFTTLSAMAKGFVGLNGAAFYDKSIGIVFKNNAFLIVVGYLASTPIFAWIGKRIEERGQFTDILKVALTILIFAVSVVAMVGDNYTPFLYEKF